MTVHNRNTNSSNWLKRLLIKIQISFSRLVLLEKSGLIVRNKLLSHSDFILGSIICALQEVRDDLYETKLNHLRDFRRYITFRYSRISLTRHWFSGHFFSRDVVLSLRFFAPSTSDKNTPKKKTLKIVNFILDFLVQLVSHKLNWTHSVALVGSTLVSRKYGTRQNIMFAETMKDELYTATCRWKTIANCIFQNHERVLKSFVSN